MNKPEYGFSDLVHIAGYGPRIFKIESFRVEHCYSPSEEWTDIVYDLIDTQTGSYVECDEEDMRLADGEDCGDALDGTGIDIFDFMGGLSGLGESYYEMEEKKMAKNNERKPSARELSSQEAAKRKQDRKDKAAKVDDLLDLYNGYMAMFDETGEAVYKENADDAMVKLAELASE
jgi:hypothetical protein